MPPQQVGGGHGRGALTAPGESLAKPGKQKISKKDSWLCVTQDKKDSYQPVCNVPVITSLKEEERLIESSTKVLGLPRDRRGPRAGGVGPLAFMLSSLTARGEAAIQQKQQQVFLHQVGGAPDEGWGALPREGPQKQRGELSRQKSGSRPKGGHLHAWHSWCESGSREENIVGGKSEPRHLELSAGPWLGCRWD